MADYGRLLKLASNRLTKALDQYSQQYEMTSTQLSVIDYLGRNFEQVITQRDIEREFSIQRSTATTMLQRMEKKQVLTREALPSDTRQKVVHLLPKGQELTKVAHDYMNHQNELLRAEFNEEELATFERVLAFYRKQEE